MLLSFNVKLRAESLLLVYNGCPSEPVNLVHDYFLSVS
jgi:hypothetical protein